MINHEERPHARLSASKVASVNLCRGKLLAEEAMPPEPPGAAALRGTVIHELAEHLLSGKGLPEETDVELLAVARNYVQAIHDFTPEIKRRYIELDVTEALQSIHPALGGTADFVGTGGGELVVADLKTGRLEVDPEWNPQLMTYALGAAIALNAPKDIDIRLAIYQPDVGGWKQWSCHMADLLDWREKLKEIATEALSENAPRNPIEDACRYCRARAVCPALRNTAVTIAKADFNLIGAPTIEDAKLCQIFAESVLEKAVEQLKANPTSIPGWKLRDGRKMIKWKDHKMAEALLADRKDAWELKSASAVQKLGVELPDGIVEETRSAPSLVKDK